MGERGLLVRGGGGERARARARARAAYIKAWEWSNCDEHDRLLNHIRNGEKEDAAIFWQEIHWGFEAQETFIRAFYAQENEGVKKSSAGIE